MALKEGTECTICGSREFMLSNGLFFCSECCTQSQDVREELTAKDDTVSFVRTLKTSVKKKAKDVTNTATNVTQLEMFQMILQIQCDALIKLGFDSSLKEAVKLIWFQYLKHCRYAFLDSQEPTTTGTTSGDQNQSDKLPSDKSSEPTSKVCKPKGKDKRVVPRSKRSRLRKSSPCLPTLTPLVTKPTRKRPCSQTKDKDRHKKTKRSRKERKEQEDTPLQNRVIPFDLSDSSDDGAVKDRLDTFSSFPDDQHLFDSSSDDSPNKSDSFPATNDDPVGSKSGMELYNALRGKWYRKNEYFCMRYTISFCYLGLLYTHQNILLADLSRWIRLHKLPYHNLASFLPRSFYAGHNYRSLMGVNPLPPDTIFSTTRSLYAFLPLPPLPYRDPHPLCHTLIDRLHLPAYFHRMMDKTLNCIYAPQFQACFLVSRGCCTNVHCRFDAECLAVIVMLLRLLYTLNDCHEFEMIRLVEGDVQSESSQEKHPTEGVELANESVYLWEDWIALYSREKLVSLQDGIPMNARELQHVTNVTNYLNFCRVEVFDKSRLSPMAPIKSTYQPHYFAKIADIFKQHRHKTRDKKATDECLDELYHSPEILNDKPKEVEASFQPRRVPVQALVDDPWSLWKQYEELQPSARNYKMFGVELSHSMRFLLDVCVELIDIHIVDMYDSLLTIELSLINNILPTFRQIDTIVLKDSYIKDMPHN